MADVARRAGVSLKTVSRVVNGEPSVRSAVRDRVLAAARELGYRPNAAARALAARRSRVIGAVTPGSAHFGSTSQLFGLERAAWEAGYSVVALDRLPGDLALPAVIPDQRAGSADATRHLLDLGHETVWRRVELVVRASGGPPPRRRANRRRSTDRTQQDIQPQGSR